MLLSGQPKSDDVRTWISEKIKKKKKPCVTSLGRLRDRMKTTEIQRPDQPQSASAFRMMVRLVDPSSICPADAVALHGAHKKTPAVAGVGSVKSANQRFVRQSWTAPYTKAAWPSSEM